MEPGAGSLAIVSAEVMGDKPSTRSWAYEAREESCVGDEVGYSGSKGVWENFRSTMGEKFRVGQAAGEVKAKGMSETRLVHTAGCFSLLPHACCHVCVPETSTTCGLCSVLQELEPQEEFRRTGLSWRLNLYLYTKKPGC